MTTVVGSLPALWPESPAVAGAVSFLLGAPLVAAWAFALVDILKRNDLTRRRKFFYGAVLILVAPATLLYLFARPVSIVGHRSLLARASGGPDWRDKLLSELESTTESPPVMSVSERREILERVASLTAGPGDTENEVGRCRS